MPERIDPNDQSQMRLSEWELRVQRLERKVSILWFAAISLVILAVVVAVFSSLAEWDSRYAAVLALALLLLAVPASYLLFIRFVVPRLGTPSK